MELSKYSKKYIHYYTGEVPVLVEKILDKCNIKSIADLGCGDGPILDGLFRKGYLGNLEKVIAVDISKERVDNARKISDKILCFVGDVSNLAMIDTQSIDFAISSQVIEHVPNDEQFIKEVYRILSKNGLFYLSTVFKKWYGWYFYRSKGKWLLDPTHVREYTNEAQLLNIIKKYDFEILKNKETLHWFSITDFVFKRIGLKQNVYNNAIANLLRIIKVPVFGYYNWELVVQKKDN